MLPLALLAPTVAVALAQSPSSPHAPITVGPNVLVSRARANQIHNEVLVGADPEDASRLIACAIVGRSPVNAMLTAAYTSFDGGATWNAAVADSSGAAGDPACIYGPGGRAYFASLARSWNDPTRLRVFFSPDGGRAWTESAQAEGSLHIDRDYLAADRTGGKYQGRIYAYAQTLGQGMDGNRVPMGITLWRSLDSGRTFGRPVMQFPPDNTTAFHPGNAVVLSDGTVAALVAEWVLSRRNDEYGGHAGPASHISGVMKLISSRDGGETLEPAIKVDSAYGDWREGSSTIPSLAVDATNGPFKDRLYAVWADGRFGGRTQIVIATSSDHGKTWSGPRLVNDDRRPAPAGAATVAAERGAAMPAVAANGNGVVGVSWYDRRDNAPNDLSYAVRFAASYDGGDSFAPSVKVSERTIPHGQEPIAAVAWSVRSAGAIQMWVRSQDWLSGGHTAGIAADAAGVFHPVWVDNRTGLHQVWTARVSAPGQGVKNGDATLAELDDVSQQVMLDLTDAAWDPARREVRVAARLRNTAKEPVHGPFAVRALTMASALGTPRAVNADLDGSGDGAVWQFTSALKGAELAPGGVSDSRTLLFHIDGAAGEGGDAARMEVAPGIIQVDAKILGRKAAAAARVSIEPAR